MKGAYIILLLTASGVAAASGGRSLPTGESDPAVVEKMYSSPRGEVHFVKQFDGHSAFLRTVKNGLAGLQETRGPVACDEWLLSNKTRPLPRGCDFYFRDEDEGGVLSIRSEEMEESSLFDAHRSAIQRGSNVTL